RNVIATGDEEIGGEPSQLTAIVEEAVGALNQMRAGEGGRLKSYLEERLAVIEAAVGRIAERAPARLIEQRDRLRLAIQELAGGINVDEQRLAQEIAIQADRLDVGEEISRFQSHFSAFRSTLSAPP